MCVSDFRSHFFQKLNISYFCKRFLKSERSYHLIFLISVNFGQKPQSKFLKIVETVKKVETVLGKQFLMRLIFIFLKADCGVLNIEVGSLILCDRFFRI